MPSRKSETKKPAAAEPGNGEAAGAEETQEAAAEPQPAGASTHPQEADGDGTTVVEPPEEAVQRLRDELDELKDRHLRLAAEYDNFRKRTARERSETWHVAQAHVVSQLLDALDDLGRVLDLEPESSGIRDVITGVELVERKLVRELGSAGLERVGEAGEPFDPNHHEAVGMVPAESAEEDQTVGDVLQLGYRFGGALLRPARVRVRMWQGDGGSSED